MFTIAKKFYFDAAHSLPQLPESHKCHRLHGHTYTVQIVLESEKLGDDHFVLDYGELKEFERIVMTCDHTFLNDLFSFPTTVENLAKFFYEEATAEYGDLVKSVEVREGFKTFGRYGR